VNELRNPVELQVLKLVAEPTPFVYEAQVVAMMLQSGTVEVGFERNSLEQFPYAAGDVVLCRRHVDALVRSQDAVQTLALHVSDAILQETAGEKNTEVEFRSDPNLQDERIRALLTAANYERITGYPCDRLFLESIEIAVAAVLVKDHAAAYQRFRRYRGGLTPSRLRNVVEFVRSQVDEDLSLKKMAEVSGLNVTHFSYMFRESIGESPHRFVLRQRVERAKELLRLRESRMLDVAVACGFKTQQHFARVFRTTQGVSPTEYRRRISR
jgi:AraC family transcriptional regulator